jgi:SAM-dependent methyltransferase
VTSAADRWAHQLEAWAIPDEILATAPESPWGFRPSMFRAPDPDDGSDGCSRRRALEALPDAGTLLDVGAGGGAASLPVAVAVAGGARQVVAVDESADMLAALAARADELGVAHVEVVGRWPDVADQVGPADVVVCHHVAYNVAALAPFALALTDHARRRVVMELTVAHPRADLAPLWRHFHHLERPAGPTADDAVAVLVEAGLDVSAETFVAPARPGRDRAEWVALMRRALCLTADRDGEIDALLPAGAELGPRHVVALWWPGSAGEDGDVRARPAR